jgi:hypothetical protein
VLSRHGRNVLEAAVRVHKETVGELFMDRLSNEQAAVICAWSEQTIAATSSASDPTSR